MKSEGKEVKATLALHTNSNVDLNKIRVIKARDNGILPRRRDDAMKRIADLRAELGRITKLVDELAADLLHLTVN